MMSEAQRSRRGFKKRYLLWIVLLVGPAAFVCFRAYTHTQLNERIEALSRQGYPMTLAELDVWYREHFSGDSDNQWSLYAEAIWDYVAWSEQERKKLPIYSRDFKYGRGETWEPIHLAEAKAFLADNEDCLNQLVKATGAGRGQPPYDLRQGRALLVPDLHQARDCARLLALAGETAVREGDMATLGVASQGILSLADSVKSPLPVGHLVSMGMKGLWVHVMEDMLNVRTLPEKQLEILQSLVDPAVMDHGYEQSLICERVFDLELFRASAKDIETKMTTNSIHRAPEFGSATIALRKVLGLHDLDALSYINDMQKKIEAATLPPHEARSRFSVTGKTDHEHLGPIARELVSSHFRVHRIVTRNLAKLQCARTALALERYRLVRGRLPGTLDELVSDYLVGVPHDPFDGQQLRYRRLATGYVVYSIGQDLTDNQGEERITGEAGESQNGWDETFIVER